MSGFLKTFFPLNSKDYRCKCGISRRDVLRDYVSLSFSIATIEPKYVSRRYRRFLCRAAEENAKEKIDNERVCARRPDLRDRDGVRDRDEVSG